MLFAVNQFLAHIKRYTHIKKLKIRIMHCLNELYELYSNTVLEFSVAYKQTTSHEALGLTIQPIKTPLNALPLSVITASYILLQPNQSAPQYLN